MTSCNIALKEWAVTLCALNQGRQIVLLRKGGLLDPATETSEAGTFAIEYSNFWLMPTFLHQDTKLVKPEHRDLFEHAQSMRRADEKQFLALQTWARSPEYKAAVQKLNEARTQKTGSSTFRAPEPNRTSSQI